MNRTRKRLAGTAFAALFAFSQIAWAVPVAMREPDAAFAAEDDVTLETYCGDALHVTLTEDGKLPALPVPVREGYDFVGWFTKEVEVVYWGDDDDETWQKMKETYGGGDYRYLNGKPISWYQEAETPDDPTIALPQGSAGTQGAYDWANARWIEHSVGVLNATEGERVEEGSSLPAGSTLYAMYDPKNITVVWYNNGWNGSNDTEYVSTGRSSGFEYGGKFAYLPLDKWDPWEGHSFKGWVDENGTPFEFALNTKSQDLVSPYAPGKYEPVLRAYAIYDDVTKPAGTPEKATYLRVEGNGNYFDPDTGSTTFVAVFDSRYKIYPDIRWEITDGEDLFDLTISRDRTSATVTAKADAKDKIAESGENRRVEVRLTVGDDAFTVYATASHEWNNGKIISGLYNRCTEPMDVLYTCRNCNRQYTHTYEADGHRYTYVDHPATCTENATRDRYCVVCGKTEHEILAGTALGHSYSVTRSSGCSGTVITETCTRCGLQHTEEDHTAVHSWNSFYTVDRAATCTTEGSKSIRCSVCGAVKESVTIPATGHRYTEKRTAATCTTGGTLTRTCVNCGDRIHETTSAPLGHNYSEKTETGCNGATFTTKTCLRCKKVETVGDKAALAHVWAKDFTVEQAPSCTEAGYKTIRCLTCGTVGTREELPALGHTFEEETETGCNGATFTTKTCISCGTVETVGDRAALAHVWAKEYAVEKAPSCTKTGLETLRCLTCGIEHDHHVLPALGHTFDEVTETGCGGATFTTKTCISCGAVETIGDRAALEHEWELVPTVDCAPTCAEAGSRSVHCAKCGERTRNEVLPADEALHAWSDWQTEREAAVGAEGLSVRSCPVCGLREERAIPALPAPVEEVKEEPIEPEPALPEEHEADETPVLPEEQEVIEEAPALSEEQGIEPETVLPEASAPKARPEGTDLESSALSGLQLAETETSDGSVWTIVAVCAVCGAALLCVPVAVAIKRRK